MACAIFLLSWQTSLNVFTSLPPLIFDNSSAAHASSTQLICACCAGFQADSNVIPSWCPRCACCAYLPCRVCEALQVPAACSDARLVAGCPEVQVAATATKRHSLAGRAQGGTAQAVTSCVNLGGCGCHKAGMQDKARQRASTNNNGVAGLCFVHLALPTERPLRTAWCSCTACTAHTACTAFAVSLPEQRLLLTW